LRSIHLETIIIVVVAVTMRMNKCCLYLISSMSKNCCLQ